MLLGRNQFFVLLFLIVVLPFFAVKIIWLAKSKETIGVMSFIGHDDIGSALGMSTYAVIGFKPDKDSVFLHSSVALNFTSGERISIRYQKNNPADAVVNDFFNIWMGTISYAIFPLLIVIVLYVMPERFDPLIPRKSKVLIGKGSLIKIIPS